MSKKIVSISKAEVDKMINEEVKIIRHREAIKKRIAAINEEISRLSDDTLEEVEAGESMDMGDEQSHNHGQKKAEFEKKKATNGKDAVHMKEMEDLEDGLVPETFEEKLAAIGRELDAKIGAEVESEPEDEIEISDFSDDESEESDEDIIEIPSDEDDALEIDSEIETDEEEGIEEEGGESEDEEIITGEEAGELNESKEKKSLLEARKEFIGDNTLLAREIERNRRLAGLK
jgi:hypothetical protein